MSKFNWEYIKQTLREDLVVLPHFFRNPIQGMRHLPPWQWPTILILQGGFALVCSVIANLIVRDFFALLTGIVVVPIMNYMMVAVVSGFFYYFAKFRFHREVPFRAVYLNVLFASIPLVILTTVTSLVPPLVLVGCAAGLLLLFVGFVDNFQFPARPLRNLFLVIMTVYAAYWGFQQVSMSSKHKTLQKRASPESLDILEKEMK